IIVVVISLCAPRVHAAGGVRGVSVASLNHRGAGYGSDACRKQLERIAATGGTWVAFNDFAWMSDVNRPQVRFAGEGRSNEGDLAQAIRDAHTCGLKV